MRKGLLIFTAALSFSYPGWCATSRDAATIQSRNSSQETSTSRASSSATQSRAAVSTAVTRSRPQQTASRNASVQSRAGQSRAAVQSGVVNTRGAPQSVARGRTAIISSHATQRSAGAARSAVMMPKGGARARAAATGGVVVGSNRTGAAYEQCKNAYFACMDQFCAVKDEKYRRCSCSDRIFELDEQQKILEEAAMQINDFNAGLDAVGLDAAQAAAMRKATEGELAMGDDKSAGKRILNAIMNSISGSGETKVADSGVLEQLNAVSFGSDSGLFGSDSNGQAIAANDGTALYTAVYGQCRGVVRGNCTDDALQRAVTAYLMAVESDCGTVSRMLDENKKKMTAAASESGAMLSLARIEDRRARNALNATECLDAVETAIKDEQVCGNDYKKCLDNGEFINKDTGKPFSGVINFYMLGELLTFDQGTALGDQKLTAIPHNRVFVQNFVQRNKKFADPVLGQCAEFADAVWRDYLDKAMIEIYYAQTEKVREIKNGCFDFVRECYIDGKKSITDLMKDIMEVSGAQLLPEATSLTNELCSAYVESCNKMFDEDLVANYVKKVDDTDIMTQCRNVAKECFVSYGGPGYNNFYNPSSGLFVVGHALDWFTIYTYGADMTNKIVTSPCAKKLLEIPSCAKEEVFEKVFGGFDKLVVDDCYYYGTMRPDMPDGQPSCGYNGGTLQNYIITTGLRPTGVASEMYNQVVGTLQNDCRTYVGHFVEYRLLERSSYCRHDSSTMEIECNPKKGCYNMEGFTRCFMNDPCTSTFHNPASSMSGIAVDFRFKNGESVCLSGYGARVDTTSWGVCSCWANGGRRAMSDFISCQVHIPGLTDVQTNDGNQVCPAGLVSESSILNASVKDRILNQTIGQKVCACPQGAGRPNTGPVNRMWLLTVCSNDLGSATSKRSTKQ